MAFNFLENKLLKSIQLGVKNGLINEGFDLDDFDLDDLNDITIKKHQNHRLNKKYRIQKIVIQEIHFLFQNYFQYIFLILNLKNLIVLN